MINIDEHIISDKSSIKEALEQLNSVSTGLTLFVTDKDNKILGTITDGDIRRGLISNVSLETCVTGIMNKNFKYLLRYNYTLDDVNHIKADGISLVPVVDDEKVLKKIVDISKRKSLLPVDAVIMAGGEGRRLRPLTEKLPKPLLKVGSKPIIEYNIDRLAGFGIENVFISINYLGNLLVDYLQDGSHKGINIHYIRENKPMGTLGSISKIENFYHNDVLIINSDILTNIDFEDFYKEFIYKSADMAVAITPYKIDVPYAVLETKDDYITSFKEKPTYTYYCNAGIYLLKKEVLETIPKDDFFNATDLIEELISKTKKVIYFPILGYWLDIGKHEDYLQAQEDVKHILF